MWRITSSIAIFLMAFSTFAKDADLKEKKLVEINKACKQFPINNKNKVCNCITKNLKVAKLELKELKYLLSRYDKTDKKDCQGFEQLCDMDLNIATACVADTNYKLKK